ADVVDVGGSGAGSGRRAQSETSFSDLIVHLSTQLPADLWVVELRRGSEPYRDGYAGMRLQLPESGAVELLTPYGATPGRLWVATLRLGEPLLSYLAVHGRPIRYGYARGEWPITMYQNVYANEPGS